MSGRAASRRRRLGPGRSALSDAGSRATRSRDAEALYGYGPYLDRVPVRAGQSRHRVRQSRGRRARRGRAAARRAGRARRRRLRRRSRRVRHGGGGLRSRSKRGPESWRALDVAFVPGITAMLAVAARIGAPLGHDFCALSLSDNLKPWDLVERRLDAAAGAGFVIALYNPVSRARPWQFGNAHRAAAPATAADDAGRVRPRRRAAG